MQDLSCSYPMMSLSDILKTAPPTAQAMIVAELDVDKSEGMIDYYGHSTVRHVVIGWRHTKRESFKALRQAAAQFPPTAHLGPNAPSTVEHRENYSMGAGNYVKDGWTHSDGWKVRSQDIKYLSMSSSVQYEYAVPEKKMGVAASPVVEDVTIKHNLDKNGIEVYFPSKPEQEVIEHLKYKGYRWSKFNKCWYTTWSAEKWDYINNYLEQKEKHMGWYIETGKPTGKAEDIAEKFQGEIIPQPPASFAEIPEGKALIVVFSNGPFEAAGFAFDEQEFNEFTDTKDDHRPRKYVLIDRTTAILETGYTPVSEGD